MAASFKHRRLQYVQFQNELFLRQSDHSITGKIPGEKPFRIQFLIMIGPTFDDTNLDDRDTSAPFALNHSRSQVMGSTPALF